MAIESFLHQLNSSFLSQLRILFKNQGNSAAAIKSLHQIGGNLFSFGSFFSALIGLKGNRQKSLDIVRFLSLSSGNKSGYNATTNKLLSVNFISFVTILILCHEYHSRPLG